MRAEVGFMGDHSKGVSRIVAASLLDHVPARGAPRAVPRDGGEPEAGGVIETRE